MSDSFKAAEKRMRYSAAAAMQAAFGVFAAALGIALAFPQPAFAYVDPSVMTYTIQALAGVAVALSAVAGVAFRRSRKTLLKAFDIDENANKQVDARIRRVEYDGVDAAIAQDGAELEAAAASGQAGGTAVARPRKAAENLPWKKKLVFALCVVAFCGFTLGIAAPFEIVAGAHGDLFFRLGDIAFPMIAFTAVAAVVVTLLLSVLPSRIYTPILVLAFSFGLACYVQSLALNLGLPAADGRDVDWTGDYMPQIILSAVVWLAILIVPLVLQRRNRPMARLVVCCFSVALIVVQGVGVLSLVAKEVQQADPMERKFVTDEGLYTVDSENNIIVFVLDCYDTKVFAEALEEDPAMVEELEGFTWYRNHAGVMIPTSFAVPYLFTGVTPVEGQDIVGDYTVSRYTQSNFLEDFDEAHYSVGLYTDSFGLAYLDNAQEREQIMDHTMNFLRLDINGSTMSYREAIVLLVRCALYRDMPWALKWRFWFYTDELNSRIIRADDDASTATNYYVINDARYLDRLEARGLAIEEGDYEGAFRFIHMFGAHYPFSVDENGEDIGVGNSTKLRQARGTMRMVGEYLRQMKELGVYDGATIIITSDHGDWWSSMQFPDESTEPIMLVKRAGENGDTWESLQASDADAEFAAGLLVSDAPVSHAEFHGTVLEAMGLHDDMFTTTFDTAFDQDRVRPFFHILHSETVPRIYALIKYDIQGDVLDFANWTYTGEIWEMDYNNDLN